MSAPAAAAASPDAHADGLLESRPDPLRYDHHSTDPAEVGGIVAALVPQGARVLDVGCGTGALSQLLVRERGVEIVGIEADAVRAGAARARGLDVRQAAFEDVPLPTLGTFDCVLLADVLEHLPDPAATLRRAHAVLTPGGVVVASVPNVAHWSVRWNLLRGRFDYEPCGIMDATHLRWFTERSLRALFEASGYDVDAVRQTVGAWLPAYRAVPLRWLPAAEMQKTLMLLTRMRPSLFGCQHVVRARRAVDAARIPQPAAVQGSSPAVSIGGFSQ